MINQDFVLFYFCPFKTNTQLSVSNKKDNVIVENIWTLFVYWTKYFHSLRQLFLFKTTVIYFKYAWHFVKCSVSLWLYSKSINQCLNMKFNIVDHFHNVPRENCCALAVSTFATKDYIRICIIHTRIYWLTLSTKSYVMILQIKNVIMWYRKTQQLYNQNWKKMVSV